MNTNYSTITYNRKYREYQVLDEDGEVFATHQSGPAGKQMAVEASILHDDPAAHAAAYYLVHDLFRERADLHGRIWKAAALVATGKVFAAHPLRDNIITVAHVASMHQGYYPVQEFSMGHACDCLDFVNRQAPPVRNQRLCKHILALKIHKIINRPLPPFLASPNKLYAWMEETGASMEVVGAYRKGHYTAYPEPIRRQAVANEVVHHKDGDFWRLAHNGQKFISCIVTDEIAVSPRSRAAGKELTADNWTVARRATGLPDRYAVNSRSRQLREMQRRQSDANDVKIWREEKEAWADKANASLFGAG